MGPKPWIPVQIRTLRIRLTRGGPTHLRALTAALRYLVEQSRNTFGSRRKSKSRPEMSFGTLRQIGSKKGPLMTQSYLSDQTASSFPCGSEKWNRRPPGNEKISLHMLPPLAMTLSFIASRSCANSTISAAPFAVTDWRSDLKKPPSSFPSEKALYSGP